MRKAQYTILILEDNDAIRESYMNFFDDRDWHILAAETAEEALAIMKTETPDGIVVDIRLPGMSGNTFIRKAVRLNSDVAFVIVTYSPDYHLPKDIKYLPQISPEIFTKPVNDLTTLEKALLKQIKICQTQKSDPT